MTIAILVSVIILTIIAFYINEILFVKIKGKFKVGDVKIISYEKVRRKIQTEKTTSEQFMKYDVKLTVEKKKGRNLIIKWEYLKETIEDNLPISNMKNIDFKPTYLLFNNKKGLLGVENWEEVRDSTFEMIDLMKTQTIKDEMPEEQKVMIEKAMNNMKLMYDTKEKVETIALKSIQAYFASYGVKYRLNKKYIGAAMLPNAFGGNAIPSKITQYAQKVNKDKVEVTIKQEVNFLNAENIMKGIKENILKELGIQEIDVSEIYMNDLYKAEYSKKQGLANTVSNERIISALDMISIEETRFLIK